MKKFLAGAVALAAAATPIALAAPADAAPPVSPVKIIGQPSNVSSLGFDVVIKFRCPAGAEYLPVVRATQVQADGSVSSGIMNGPSGSTDIGGCTGQPQKVVIGLSSEDDSTLSNGRVTINVLLDAWSGSFPRSTDTRTVKLRGIR